MLPTSQSAADYSPQKPAVGAHHTTRLTVSGSLRNEGGGGEHDSVVDEDTFVDATDFPGADGLISSGLEHPQYFFAVVDNQRKRVVPPARAGYLRSIARVEPRFLRYSRLLN
jgi:hypothetical protein